MKQTTKKKGFTIVELVIVIAVVAILAAVLIPTFVNLTEKAKQSVDEQLCANYNKILQAECVMNEDITLGEFITVIEENGINSNHFNTSSKLYTFAFYSPDEGRKECVLLNKEDGTVLYPQHRVGSADVTPAKLWATMDDNQVFQKGVKNYTLTKSFTYNPSVSKKETPIGFDLNSNAMMFNSNPTTDISVKNGTVVGTGIDKVHFEPVADKVTHLDTSKSDWGAMKATNDELKTEAAKLVDQAGTNVTLTNKQFFASSDAQNLALKLGYGLGNDAVAIAQENKAKPIVISNCTFSGMTFWVQNQDADVVIDNCVFKNTASYGLRVDSVKSITIKNCTFEGTNRGILLNIPANKTEICNNTFTLNKIISSKGERKDNAIQFSFDNPSHYIQSGSDAWKNPTTFKVEIHDNNVIKAQALVTLHAGFAINTGVNKDMHYINAFKTLISDETEEFVFTNNTLNGAAKIVADPGMEGDLNSHIKDNKVPADQKENRITAFNAILAELETKIQ